MGKITRNAAKGGNEKEMITPMLRDALTKQGTQLVYRQKNT